ncbi:hypothetical protein OB920_07050 [Halobacteria archaeon HArc-gm2]|nr:hypothetical protein [Halobacteria archaeon HArc-gm2]
MFLIHVVAGFVAAFLLFGPAIYTGLQLLPGEPAVEYPVAAATALVGVLVAGLIDGLLGWLPVVGVLLAPLAWSAVVRRFGRASWPASFAVGFATWALSRLLYAGLSGL